MSNPDSAAKPSLNFARIIPVVLAGVAGGGERCRRRHCGFAASIRLALVPGRYAVAVPVAGTLPFIFLFTRQPISPVLGLVMLTLVPSLLAKLVFSARAPWSIVLLLSAVYALVSLAVYALAGGEMRRS
jgi:hypothetical protein